MSTPGETGHLTGLTVYTIGHSTRSLEEFLSLLQEFHIGAVADIRRYPSSRKFPHFDRTSLERSLGDRGILYRWFESLGGRRHGSANAASPNTGLRSKGFRNYADHMMSAEFRQAVEGLARLAAGTPTAVMCAEKLFWKCHRRLVSDYLTARGAAVRHIVEEGGIREHALTPGARKTGDGITYQSTPDGSG